VIVDDENLITGTQTGLASMFAGGLRNVATPGMTSLDGFFFLAVGHRKESEIPYTGGRTDEQWHGTALQYPERKESQHQSIERKRHGKSLLS
jgi:hypothetical protein